jgi:hypothetical protein
MSEIRKATWHVTFVFQLDIQKNYDQMYINHTLQEQI